MDIKQFRYGLDNFGYLVYHEGHGIAIDGGAVDPILSFSRENGIRIDGVTNTHYHADHTTGTKTLSERSGAELIDSRDLGDNSTITIGNKTLRVLHTPGHTLDSVVFVADTFMVTGDTIFNGTVGNCFTGRLDLFYHSIKKIISLDPKLNLFAGHDYLDFAMAVARKLEPDNKDIETYVKKCDPDHLFSTIEDELCVNPYLRYNEKSMIQLMRRRGLPTETENERWASIMSLE